MATTQPRAVLEPDSLDSNFTPFTRLAQLSNFSVHEDGAPRGGWSEGAGFPALKRQSPVGQLERSCHTRLPQRSLQSYLGLENSHLLQAELWAWGSRVGNRRSPCPPAASSVWAGTSMPALVPVQPPVSQAQAPESSRLPPATGSPHSGPDDGDTLPLLSALRPGHSHSLLGLCCQPSSLLLSQSMQEDPSFPVQYQRRGPRPMGTLPERSLPGKC